LSSLDYDRHFDTKYSPEDFSNKASESKEVIKDPTKWRRLFWYVLDKVNFLLN
jgi:hypothetical protein